MSRLFSITSMVSDATICRAETTTINPIAMEIAIFSSQSAENSAALSCDQSSVR